MDYATLTNQNQITIPMKVRDRLQLNPSDKLVFYESGTGIKVEKLKSIRDFDGLLKGYKYKLTKKDIEGVWLERGSKYRYEKQKNK
jgi:AbrB family looped-hinge helix DNA binding protein